MKIAPFNMLVKIISDCISNKYKSYDPNEYKYWNIDLINESNDMFILSCHNYDINLSTPESVKNPSGYSWYCFLDMLERSRHVIAKSILQEQIIDFISPLDMLKHSSLRDTCIEEFLDFLLKKKITKRNLATIKQIILNNKTTIIYLSFLKKGTPVFEIMFDDDAKLIDKIISLFQEWIKAKNIFSYFQDPVSKNEYPINIEDPSLFYDVFEVEIVELVDFIIASKPDDAKNLLIDLVGIPEHDLKFPIFVKDNLPNLFIVKGTI